MTRLAQQLVTEFDLSSEEADYLRSVAKYAKRLPTRPRRALVRETAEMLSGRPPDGSSAELEAALGQPADYVQEWRTEEGFSGKTAPWKHWWHQSTVARGTQVAVLFSLLVGGLALRSYYAATPQIFNSCAGAIGPGVEMLEAGNTTEYRMALRIGERYGVDVCPSSSIPGVTIERVYFANPVQMAIQPVGWQLNLERLSTPTPGDASAHRSWRPEDIPWGADVIVWFEGEYCNISGGHSFGHLSVDYRYRGRSRTASLDLNATYSVWAEPDQCSDTVREADEAADRSWERVVDMDVVYSNGDPDNGGYGPIELAPVAISRDLCRYLRGVDGAREPLGARAVFQLGNDELSSTLIDGAVLGVCPEFADQRDTLVALLD